MIIKNLFIWCLVFTALSISGQLHAQEASSRNETTIITENNGVQRWRTSTGVTDFNIECRGKIELTEDDKDIRSLSDDGYLEINKTVFGSKRTILIESLGGGRMKKEYYEGRTLKDWGTNGKEWLAEVLPDLVRSSTIGAQSRVDRFFKSGGPSAVLKEIEELNGDYLKSHYAKLLLEKNIPGNDLPRVINTLASNISSDYYLSSLLKDSMKKLMATKESADAFFKATEKVSSDYYRSVVLKDALQAYAASPDQVKSILRSASTIGSDYYLSVVLTALLDESEVKEESLAELVNISKNIGSDYYRTEVLNKALQKKGASKEMIRNTLAALANVSSAYYKSNVLNSMAERTSVDAELQSQLITMIGTSVGSDYYASISFGKVLQHQELSDQSFQLLVDYASKMSSSNYAADVLRQASRKTLTEKQLVAVIRASANINSEHYLTTVLQSLAPAVKTADNSVKDAYRQTAKSIKSETYYGRALRAIE